MKKRNNFFTLDRHHAEGFTLVELIVVIAILAILGGVAVPAYSGYVEKAEQAADDALLAELNTAFAAACAINGEDHIDRPDVSVSLDANKRADVTVSGITGFDGAFDGFYEGGEFKYYSDLIYQKATGTFRGNYSVAELIQMLKDSWNGSSFGADGGEDVAKMLLGTMDAIDGYLSGDQPFSALFEGVPSGLLAALGFTDMSDGFEDMGVLHFAEDAKNRTAEEVLAGATGLMNLLNLKDNETYLSQVTDELLVNCYYDTLPNGDDTVFGDTTWGEMTWTQKIQAANDNLGLVYGDLNLTAKEVAVLTYAAGTGAEGITNSADVSGLGGMYALAAGFYNSEYGKNSSTKPSGDDAAEKYGQFGTVQNAMNDPNWTAYMENQALKDMEAYVSFMGYLSEGEFGEGTTFSGEGYEWIADALGMK